MNQYENLLTNIRDIIENGRHHRSEIITLNIIEEIKIILNNEEFNKNLEQAIALQPIFLLFYYYRIKKLPDNLHNAMVSHAIKNPDDPYVKSYFKSLAHYSNQPNQR
jgi:hypothetical protein